MKAIPQQRSDHSIHRSQAHLQPAYTTGGFSGRSMKRRSWRWLLLVAVILGGVWFFGTNIEEARYSPFTLEFQKRTSFEILDFPVFVGDWKAAPNDLLDYIQRKGFVVPLSDADPKWQTVYRFTPTSHRGWSWPYWILRSQFVDWSEQHPDAAALLWKPAFRMLRSPDDNVAASGLGYVFAARNCKSVDEVRKLIDAAEDELHIPLIDHEPSKLPVPNDNDSKTAMLNLEDQFLFFPTKKGDWKPDGLDFQDVYFTADDGVKLHGWYCPCPNPRAVVLHAHGNGGNLANRAPLLRQYQRQLRVTSFIFDYRGYGRSEGTPSVVGILKDARAARKWLAEKTGLKESQLVLTGQSLGGAVAVDLAVDGGARGLVLESTFSSLKDVAAVHYPQLAWLASPKKLNSALSIKQYHGPLLMTHGDKDDIIPYELGSKLFDAANEPKQWIREPGGVHNHATSPEFAKALDQFIENLPR